MKIFAISDTHFNHKKLIEYGRPNNFEELILKNLSRVHGDLLIHCGDFCIGKNEESHKLFMEATKGFSKKILVKGNHDPQSDSWYLTHGWDFVCESFVTTYFGKKYIFSHIPIIASYGNVERFSKNIHGHMHGNYHRAAEVEQYDPEWNFDLAPEIRNYQPVNLENI